MIGRQLINCTRTDCNNGHADIDRRRSARGRLTNSGEEGDKDEAGGRMKKRRKKKRKKEKEGANESHTKRGGKWPLAVSYTHLTLPTMAVV